MYKQKVELNLKKEKNAGNFPEKLAENFRKFSGKFPIFPRKFSGSHHYKTMVFGENETDENITTQGNILENVESFTYLGCTMTHDLDCKKEVTIRFAKAMTLLKAMDKIWSSKSIKWHTKLRVLDTCVFSSALYGCEAWVITKEIQNRIMAFERKCYRKLLRIRWTDKIRNEELYQRVQVEENLMSKVIKRKMNLFGHICRMTDDRKIKTLVFGVMEGRNRRGRPHREWVDDVTQWCGTSLQAASHWARNRSHWRRVVDEASDTYGHCAHGS